MSYLLDTSACIQAMTGTPKIVLLQLDEHIENSAVSVSSIVIFELMYGVHKSMVPARGHERLQRLLDRGVTVLSFDEADAEAAGRIRATLEARKEAIGHYDTLIAGQALARHLTLVTANVREFRRVDGLLWEDWSRS